jgi:dihydroflavonol-4-reductase
MDYNEGEGGEIMKCIVTGATGHIGTALVRELHEAGHELKLIVLPGDDIRHVEPFGIVAYGNILDVSFLRSEFAGWDWVFHLAGIVEIGSGKKKRLWNVNVEGTKNVVDICIETGVKRLLYTSSVHAIPELPKGTVQKETDRFDPRLVRGTYAKTKAAATAYVLSKKDLLDIVVVHPSGVIGPGDYKLSNVSQMFIDFLMGRLTAYLKGGYNFVDVRDLATGIRRAADTGRSGNCYILSGHEITVKELLDHLANFSGRKQVRTKLAYWFILAMSYFAEAFYLVVKRKPLFTHYSIVVLHSNYAFDNDKAKRELDFHSRPIRETIQDTLAFVETNYLIKKGKRFGVRVK